MATSKKVETTSLSPNLSIRLEEAIRDLRQALKDGYTHLEARDAVIHHPEGPEPLRDVLFPTGR